MRQKYVKFYPSELIRTRGNPMVDPAIVWKVASSTGVGSYDVTMHDRGFVCTCPAFAYRGLCRHVKHIEQHIVRCFND